MNRICGVCLVLAVVACKGSDSKLEKRDPAISAPTPGDAASPADAAVDPGPKVELDRCAVAPLAPIGPIPNRPRVKLGASTVKGPLAKAAVDGLLKQRVNRLRYCYEQGLVRNLALAGTAPLTILIRPEGFVHEAYVEPRFDDELAMCVKHIISELKFPEAAGATDKTTVTQPITFEWPRKPNVQVGRGSSTLWTPFAASTENPADLVAETASAAVRKALPMGKLAQCYGAKTGSIRSVVVVGKDGTIASARSGGLGDAVAEACMDKALAGVKTEAIADRDVEVACDLHRGAPSAWRVSIDGGYLTADLTAGKGALPTPTVDVSDMPVVFVTDAKTTAAQLRDALKSAKGYGVSIVALKYDEGAPLYVAAGLRSVLHSDPSTPFVVTTGAEIGVCGGLQDSPKQGAINDADKLIAAAAKACPHRPCPATLTISVDTQRPVSELAAIAGAARASGFERIAIGSDTCP